MDNLLSLEEVKRFLEIEEPDLQHLIQQRKLNAYKIGGSYVRFRKEEVLTLKQARHPHQKSKSSISWTSRVGDFWRFNNFYILSLLLIVFLFYVVMR